MLFIQLRKVVKSKQHVTIFRGEEVYSPEGFKGINRVKEIYTGTMLNAPIMQDTHRVLELGTPNSYDGDLEVVVD